MIDDRQAEIGGLAYAAAERLIADALDVLLASVRTRRVWVGNFRAYVDAVREHGALIEREARRLPNDITAAERHAFVLVAQARYRERAQTVLQGVLEQWRDLAPVEAHGLFAASIDDTVPAICAHALFAGDPGLGLAPLWIFKATDGLAELANLGEVEGIVTTNGEKVLPFNRAKRRRLASEQRTNA